MSASAKIPLSGLSRGELEALVERLLAENAALKPAIIELRAEVATRTGVKGRPKVRPSGMEKGTEPEPADTGRDHGTKARKVGRLTIHEERAIAADVPAGSRFKGYEDFLVQDLVLRPHVVRLRRERWLTPDGRTVTAPMPAGITGHFGPELRREACPPAGTAGPGGAVPVSPGSADRAASGGPAAGDRHRDLEAPGRQAVE